MFWINFAQQLTWLIPIEIAVGIGFLYFSKATLRGCNAYLLAYLSIALLVDLFSRWAGNLLPSNLMLVPIFALLELSLLSIIYFRYMLRKRELVLRLIAATSILFMLAEIAYLNSMAVAYFQSYSRPLASLIVVIYALAFLFQNIQQKTTVSHSMPLNIIFLSYFACNFFIYLPINFFINADTETKYLLWIFNLTLVFIYYLALFRHIWQSGKTPTPLSFGYSSP